MGTGCAVQVRKIPNRRIRSEGTRTDVVGDVQAVVSVNEGAGRTRTRASSRQRVRAVQRGRRSGTRGGRSG